MSERHRSTVQWLIAAWLAGNFGPAHFATVNKLEAEVGNLRKIAARLPHHQSRAFLDLASE